MPYTFDFYVAGNLRFRGHMHSRQCRGICASGARCQRRVIIGYEYCFQHLHAEKHLTIEQSTIANAGLGLFAWLPPAQGNAIVFRQGDTICRYDGQIVDHAQLNARYTANGTAPYAIKESANRYDDAATERTVGSLANTSPGNNNATISVAAGATHIVSLRATKNICAGQEIFLSYGPSYHINQPGYSYRTVKRAL